MNVSVCRTAGLALAVVGALSCARSRCDEATGTCAGSATTVVALGEDVVLTPGRLVEVGTSGARLSFEAVTTDSRCPTDVQCVWAGNATARVRVWGDAGMPRTVELNSSVEPKQIPVDGYLLRFVALTPDPVSTTRIEPAKYRLTVRLERAN
jgi:hypothetical protein